MKVENCVALVTGGNRGIGEGWARGVLGGSTGGWEAFAAQVLYPDDFNYAAAACPPPMPAPTRRLMPPAARRLLQALAKALQAAMLLLARLC